jgi:hypothetical protein
MGRKLGEGEMTDWRSILWGQLHSVQCQTIVYISGPHANVSLHDILIPTSLPLVEYHLKGEHQFLIIMILGGWALGFSPGT